MVRKYLALLAGLVVLILSVVTANEILDQKQSIYPSLLWVTILCGALVLHMQARIRYTAQLRVARVAEKAGDLEKGTIALASNQRFRYTVRVAESIAGILVGITSIFVVYHPAIATWPWYSLSVLTYFYGTMVATGYLTLRDLHVLDSISIIDETTSKEDNPPSS